MLKHWKLLLYVGTFNFSFNLQKWQNLFRVMVLSWRQIKDYECFFVLFFYIWMLYIRLAQRGWGRQGLACLFLKIGKKCPYIRTDRPDCIHLFVNSLIWKAILEATGKNKIQNFSHGAYRSALIPRHLTCPEKVLVAHLYVVAFSCLMISTFSYILSIHEKSIFKNFAKFTGKHLSRSIKMRYLLKVWCNLQQLTWTALS